MQKRKQRAHTLFYYQLRGSLIGLLVAISTIGGMIYHFSEQALLSNVQNNLQYHADFRKERILALFSQQRTWLQNITQSTELPRLSEQLLNAYRSTGYESPLYRYLQQQIRNDYQTVFNAQGGNDLFLVTPQGELAFSLRPMEEEIGVNLGRDGFYGDNLFSMLIDQVLQQQQLSISHYGKIEQVERSTLLMGIPLFSSTPGNEQTLIGILVRPLALQRLHNLLKSYNGLGESGEVVIAQRRGGIGSGVNFINHFRYGDSSQPDPACIEIRLNQPDRFPVLHALSHTNGAGWMIDNACNPVFGVWTWIPELQWGMVVKQDRSEIMAPIVAMRYNILMAGVLILLFLVWMAQRQAHTLSRPLEQLTYAAEQDEMDSIPEGPVVELNKLAITLQQMLMILQGNEQILESQIRDRTAELKRQSNEMESILSSMEEGLLVVNNRGRITRANQKITSLMGCNHGNELIGTQIGEIFANEQEEDHLQGEALSSMGDQLQLIHDQDHDHFHQILNEAPVPLLVFNHTTTPPSLFLINEEMRLLLGIDNQPAESFPIERIIPSEGERQINALLEQSRNGIHCHENHQFCHLLNLQEQTINGVLCMISVECATNLHTIIFLKTPQTMNSALLKLTPFGQTFFESKRGESPLQRENSPLSAERILNSCNSEEIPVQISGALLQAIDGQHVDGAVLIAHDLRNRIKTERERADQLNQLAYQEGLAEMSANVLHNIGNAVAGLNGRAEMVHATTQHIEQIKQQLKQAATIDDLKQIQTGLQRLAQILDKLLEDQLYPSSSALTEGIRHISDIISTQQQMAHGHASINTRFNLDETLNKVLQLHQASNRKLNIETRIEISPALSEVNLPHNQFMQMMDNLLKNSREAIAERQQQESTPSRHQISITITPVNRQQFKLHISDTGVGIAPQQMKTIFQRNVTTKASGSGIGLHSTSTFVGSLQGTIQAHSEGVNQGASLEITLPVDGAETVPPQNKEEKIQ